MGGSQIFSVVDVMASGKRHSLAWEGKKKHFKESPVEQVKNLDYGHLKLGLSEWEMPFWACGLLLKDSLDGGYKIIVVCCISHIAHIASRYFKLTSMGPKAEELYNLIEVLLN